VPLEIPFLYDLAVDDNGAIYSNFYKNWAVVAIRERLWIRAGQDNRDN